MYHLILNYYNTCIKKKNTFDKVLFPRKEDCSEKHDGKNRNFYLEY